MCTVTNCTLCNFLMIIQDKLLCYLLTENSEASGRNANKVVLYEDAAKKQLQEFISALRGCESMAQACSSLDVMLENTESRQLHHILTPGTIGMLSNCFHKYLSAY